LQSRAPAHSLCETRRRQRAVIKCRQSRQTGLTQQAQEGAGDVRYWPVTVAQPDVIRVRYRVNTGRAHSSLARPSLTQCMVRPCVARVFVELVVSGLASMYPASDWSSAPGHHGYQRACDLISDKASTGPFGSPVFAVTGVCDLLRSEPGDPRKVSCWRVMERTGARPFSGCSSIGRSGLGRSAPPGRA
jgi:hypothetical protein